MDKDSLPPRTFTRRVIAWCGIVSALLIVATLAFQGDQIGSIVSTLADLWKIILPAYVIRRSVENSKWGQQ